DEGQSTEPSTIEFAGDEDSSLFIEHYRLNAGDSVLIELISDSTNSYRPMLDNDGFITLPIMGPIQLSGLTLGEARTVVQEQVDLYYTRTWVNVQISRIGRVKFYLYGDAGSPGFYNASNSTTFFDFLQNFGLSVNPAHRRIVHVSAAEDIDPADGDNLLTEATTSELINESLTLFDRNEYEKIDPRVKIIDPLIYTLEGRIEEENFYLKYGDVIYIPQAETSVTLSGFRRSGTIEVLPGESWVDVLNIGGKPNLTSNEANMVIERRDSDGQIIEMFYNLNYLSETELNELEIRDRDRLKLMPYDNDIFVLGEVNSPGSFGYSPTSTVIDYLAMAGGTTSDAHLRFVALLRPPRDPKAPLEDAELIQVDVTEALISGTIEEGFTLQPGDILYVPNKGQEITLGTVLSGMSVLVNAIRLFE
ncbi:MAG TPA: polysaccharide biosynthesis/export family protein, partial [bacterium]